ncbi:leucine zipper putative tumor suppressor 2 homolog [Anopheles marshallii]|uniref:leucine zipper putative tumor suppressor 2 homolog n=1 Tax=Anopheles marshallii TaxID=1521116 RepID=UPI00237C03CA|nr:leucine zipper putative tumor suppressor 2 homolog [Anopheles marshallii]
MSVPPITALPSLVTLDPSGLVSSTAYTDVQRASNGTTSADEYNLGLRRSTDAMEGKETSAPSSLLLPATSPLLASYSSPGKKPVHSNGASHTHIASGTSESLRPKGHYRSSSLENNPFHPHGSKPMVGLNIAQASFTGTLKSRREQKRISDFLNKQSSGYGAGSSGASSLTLISTSREPQSESSLRKAHFENIREIFEKNNSKNAAAQQQQLNLKSTKLVGHQINTTAAAMMAANVATASELASHGGSASTLGIPIDDKPPKIQSCSGILGKGKQVIRPIAFKPVPYKCNTPNYGAPIGGRLTELSDRYGSTPSLGPTMSLQYKFGSTTDLHHLQQQGSSGSNGATPIASVGPCSSNGSMGSTFGTIGGSMMSNSYHQHYHHQYNSTLMRKGSSIPFKTYDSLESILKLPDSMVASYPNPSHSLYHQQDILDMAPSPSDSGISELEAALRDRDSELAYLRQTMEHNEQVIFKVHQDKEKHWEQELNRLKAIHESRLRAGAQKVHKLEQLLMMQTFQLRQDKKRLQEDNARLQTGMVQAKDQTEQHKLELEQLQHSAKELKDQNGDLLDEIQMLRRIISDLKERLEESEWNLCQKNGEVALMKSQLKDAQTEISTKDQEIVQLKADMKLQNYDDISIKKSEIKKELDFDLEISQLNRIVIFKDQIIVLMNNEIQKLRKELSDISLLRGYEGAPTGRYTRYKKKLELVAQKFEESDRRNDSNNNNQLTNSNSSSNTPTESPYVENIAMSNVTSPSTVISSSEIIKNYFNSKSEMNKKLFLSSQICNYSDEDKSNIIDAYGSGKQVDMTDITLDLSSLLPSSLTAMAQTPIEEITVTPADSYHQHSSSDDDYKSMTPTQEEPDHEEKPKVSAQTIETPPLKEGKRQTQSSDELDRLNRELESCRECFEQERSKWAEEKEKVLIYQRQLQKNYVEMCKRTQQLEEQLKTIQLEQEISNKCNMHDVCRSEQQIRV